MSLATHAIAVICRGCGWCGKRVLRDAPGRFGLCAGCGGIQLARRGDRADKQAIRAKADLAVYRP